MPPDLAESALDEFPTLVDSGSLAEAVAIFVDRLAIRGLLPARLEKTRASLRDEFAGAFYADGYDVEVPGVKQIEPRPWH